MNGNGTTDTFVPKNSNGKYLNEGPNMCPFFYPFPCYNYQMQITKVTSEIFDQHISTLQGPYLIKFGSNSCGPCNTMKPVLNKLAQENDNFPILEIDTNESPELASMFGIRSVPTMHFCEGREIIYSLQGVTPYRDLQFIIDNINDEYFRLTGQFKVEETKKNHNFTILVIVIISLFILGMIFLPKL